jgi:hypothetical protein
VNKEMVRVSSNIEVHTRFNSMVLTYFFEHLYLTCYKQKINLT